MTDPIDPLVRLDQETKAVYDALDDRDYYAIRVLFVSDQSDEDRFVALMPWLTYDQEHAEHIAYVAVSDPEYCYMAFGAWLNSGDVDLPTDRSWQPLAARVVRIAAVPF